MGWGSYLVSGFYSWFLSWQLVMIKRVSPCISFPIKKTVMKILACLRFKELLEVIRVSKRVKESQWVKYLKQEVEESCPIISSLYSPILSQDISRLNVYTWWCSSVPTQKSLWNSRAPPHSPFCGKLWRGVSSLAETPHACMEADDQSMSPPWARGPRPGGGWCAEDRTKSPHSGPAWGLQAPGSLLCALSSEWTKLLLKYT